MIFKPLLRLILLGLAFDAYADIPFDSLHGSSCGMVDPRTKLQVAISPIFTRVNVVITDAIAQVVVSQRFVNPFKATTETVYQFPLPDQGSVHAMKYIYHDTTYVAQIMERAKAQAKYDSIKNSGGKAALLLQEKPNIFMQRIATMNPGDTVNLEIRLSMPLKYVDGELELAFPTRIGPRFQSDSPMLLNPPEDRFGLEFEFNVLVESNLELSAITSPSHPIEVSDLSIARKILTDRQVLGSDVVPSMAYSKGVVLKTQVTYPNRDYVLRLKRAKTAPDFSLAISKDPTGQGFFSLNLYPDPTTLVGKRSNLEVVLLVDISGSQAGWPLEREKEITLNILSRLSPSDNVDLLAFSDEVYYAFGTGTPVPATAQNVSKGEAFVRGLSVQGGTQLLAGVNAALAIPANPDKQRIFIFLTDGFITNETAILSAITNHPSKPSIFTFGAGNNLNRYFLEECAKVGNGFATLVVEGNAVGPLVDAAWKRIEAPQIENIQVFFGELETKDLLFPISNRLFLGLPYKLMGKFTGSGIHSVTMTGDQGGKPITITKLIDFSSWDILSWAVPKLWAREKIGQLMITQGTSESQKPAIIALSLSYQVLSQYTAFLAANPQALVPIISNSGGGSPSEISKKPSLHPQFSLTFQGGLLFLDWRGGAKVQLIRIYDLQGRLVFSYRPMISLVGLTRWIWDGKDLHGRDLNLGLYLLSVTTQAGTQNRTFTWNANH